MLPDVEDEEAEREELLQYLEGLTMPELKTLVKDDFKMTDDELKYLLGGATRNAAREILIRFYMDPAVETDDDEEA